MTSTDIIVILDESGSMGSEPVKTINSFIKDQQKVLEDNTTFTLWKFNSIVTLVYDEVPLKDIPEFTDFSPICMTALYDSIGYAINTKLSKNKKKGVVCVILTDGEDNLSQTFNSSQIKELIQNTEVEHGWKFVYIGANQDSFQVGKMNLDCCENFDTGSTHISDAISKTKVSNPELNVDKNEIQAYVNYNIPTQEYTPEFPARPRLQRTYRVRCMICNDITHAYERGSVTTICMECEVQRGAIKNLDRLDGTADNAK